MKKIVLGVSLALIAGTTLANDNSFDDRWYVTPNVSFVKPDSDKNANSGLAAGIGFGKFVTPRISIDLELDNTTFDLRNGGELSQSTISFMGRYHFGEKSGMRPYLGLGLGGMRRSNPGSNDGIMNLAAGISKELTDKVKLRTEFRYRLENSDDTITGEDTLVDYLFNAGLSISFGEAARETTKTELVKHAPQLDGDHDGISDADDRCPNSPAGAHVDATGCDGDDDNDGVANSKDACPHSKAGAVVGSDGCEVQVVIELQGVHFDTNKATLKPESINILNAAVHTLGQHGKILVEVAGHTDSTASDAHNQNLSERRAKVVYQYLVDHGITADRMTWRGYGESQPIATNDTEEGKAKNRRTELIVK